ncbi:MAG: DegT/DnrJ/EryC1/StrS family aminotransferase, partial [Candidatus Baltobacteraceae bacterium]
LGLHGMDKDAWKRYTAAGSWRYDVREPGFKYNLADPLAALGVEQLKRLNAMQLRRDEIAAQYIERLATFPGIEVQAATTNSGDRHSWCMFAIVIDEQKTGITRDDLIDRLREMNIGTSVHYIPTHLFSGYRSLEKKPLPVTEALGRRLLSLPLYPAMGDEDVSDVLDALERIVIKKTFAHA